MSTSPPQPDATAPAHPRSLSEATRELEPPPPRGARKAGEAEASAQLETAEVPMVAEVTQWMGPAWDLAQAAIVHPTQIGHFRIVRLLGEGGMGAVYLAEQEVPVRRQVALKLIHASLRSPVALARFTAERQAMARLSHPNVAQLYEAGTTPDGFPYFAMEHLPGESFVDYCNQQQLDIRQRVAMFVQVCNGVHHAHQKGLIHRDLKPGNLLVAEAGGQAIAKVIDFGIAKAIDHTPEAGAELTGAGAIGTPSYMSPEAFTAPTDLDTRTDVYSLGIVLYELLAGVRPHDASGAALLRLIAGGQRPEQPRLTHRIASLQPSQIEQTAAARRLSVAQLSEQLRGDLDWIVGKAIAEDREQRYASVADLAADLKRFLEHEPIEARPPSLRYRAGKFVRRHRVAVLAASMVLLALILGIVGTSVGMLRAAREAEASRQVSAFLTRIFEVSDPGSARGNSVTARELLDEAAGRIHTALQDQPLVQARLMSTMSDVYQNLGLYAEAVPLAESALRVRRRALGDDDPDVGRSLTSLGTLYNRDGRYQEALTLQRQAVAQLSSSLGADSPDLAEAQMQLGLTSFMLGDAPEAEALYRRALLVNERHFGADSLEVATNLAHLGYLLGNQERFAEARSALERALHIREAALGDDHFHVSVSLDLLGDVHAGEGRNEEAEALYLRSLQIKRKVYEASHPLIAESHFALGRVKAAQGQTEAAQEQLRTGIKMVETSLGAEHINLSRGLQELGMLLANQGQWQEAELTFRRLVTVYEAAVGPDHPWVGGTLNNLGWVLSDGLRQYPQAEAVLRRAVNIFPLDQKPGFHGALARWSLANCLRDQQRHAEAEPFYIEALGIFEKEGGSRRQDNPQLPELLQDYAKSLRAAGREADALQLQVRSQR